VTEQAIADAPLLDQTEVDALAPGTAIEVTWSGGNGPHRYRVHVDKHGQRYAWTGSGQLTYNPLVYVGREPFHTHVSRPALHGIDALGEAAEALIDAAVLLLAPPGRTVKSIQWFGDRHSGDTSLSATLDDGTVIKGIGEARLQAIVDAERSLR
jgi:hypothetical protein